MRFLPAALLAAVASASLAGMIVSDDASADHRRRNDDAEQLRDENKQLRDDLSYYQSAYDELHDGLIKVDRAADKLRDRRAGARISRIAENAIDRAEQYIDGGRYDDDDYYRSYGVSDTDFEKMSQRVAAAAYADDQLALVQELAKTNYFTVAQVVGLMKSVTYEDTRVDVAVALYSRVSDAENWYQVYDALTFSSSKKTLRERIGA